MSGLRRISSRLAVSILVITVLSSWNGFAVGNTQAHRFDLLGNPASLDVHPRMGLDSRVLSPTVELCFPGWPQD